MRQYICESNPSEWQRTAVKKPKIKSNEIAMNEKPVEISWNCVYLWILFR